MKPTIYFVLITFVLFGLLMIQPVVFSKPIQNEEKPWIIEPRTVLKNGKYQCIIAPLRKKYNQDKIAAGYELVTETLSLMFTPFPPRQGTAPNPAGNRMILDIKGYRKRTCYETLVNHQAIPIASAEYTLDFNQLLKNKPGGSLLDKLVERLGVVYEITVIYKNKSSKIYVTLGIQSEDYGRFGHFNYLDNNSGIMDKDIVMDPVWEHDHIIDLKETGLPLPVALKRRNLKINKDPRVLNAFKLAFKKIMTDPTGRYQSYMAAFSLSDGIYYPRHLINKKHLLSPHSWGIAIDIDSRHNWQRDPNSYIPTLTYQNMILAEHVFKPTGFIWGGDWFTRFDPMHFEVSSGNGAVPVISPSSIKVEKLAARTVRISWQTDIESTSGVEYRLSGASNFQKKLWQGYVAYHLYRTDFLPYSKFNISDKYICIHAQTKEHSVIISGLKPNAHYRYRVISSDPYGNVAISGEVTVEDKRIILKILFVPIFAILILAILAVIRIFQGNSKATSPSGVEELRSL